MEDVAAQLRGTQVDLYVFFKVEVRHIAIRRIYYQKVFPAMITDDERLFLQLLFKSFICSVGIGLTLFALCYKTARLNIFLGQLLTNRVKVIAVK